MTLQSEIRSILEQFRLAERPRRQQHGQQHAHHPQDGLLPVGQLEGQDGAGHRSIYFSPHEALDKIADAVEAWDAMDAANSYVVPLPGSSGWKGAYEWGDKLEELFPGQDGRDFAYACEYNDYGPLVTAAGVGWATRTITRLAMLEQGENEGARWLWQVDLENGEIWRADGGCDYTGWDCQSHLSWEKIR